MKWSCYWLLAIVYLSVLGKDKLAMAINGTQGTFVPQGLANFSIQWNVTGPNAINIIVTANYSEFSGGHGFHDFWVAVGFTENTDDMEPFMFPADVVISSSMHASEGLTPLVEDRHTIEQSAPIMDTTSNINGESVLLEGTVFTMAFSRSLVTSDESDQDVSLNVPRYWIWAVGNYTNGTFIQHSYMARGVTDTPINPCFAFNCTDSSDGESSGLPLATSCEAEITTSRFGRYEWFEIDPNDYIAIPCEYGAASNDIEVPNAIRICNSSGEWNSPNFTLCRSALPEVTLSPMSEVIIVEIGRKVHVSCSVTSFNSSDHWNEGWFKIKGGITEVDSLSTFNNNNFMVDGNGLHSLKPNVTVQELGNVLFQQVNDSNPDQLNLISWMYDIDDSIYTIPTTEGIEGVYMCRGINSFGTMEAIVTIEVEAPSAQTSSSRSFIRLSSVGWFSDAFPFVSNELQLATIQSSLLEMVSADRTGIQVFNCSNITLMQPKFEERLECLIQEFPPQQSTTALGLVVLSEFQSTYPSTRNTISSETGFCDAESTSDQTYGSHSWPESVGGQTVSILCNISNSNGYARRRCLGSEDGWNSIIDYTDCRNVVTLSNPFEYYLRFSSTSSDISSSSNTSSNISSDGLPLINIRITIELSSNSIIAAHCTSVPILPETVYEQVECRVNGTSESQSYSGIQSTVIDRLIAQGLLVQGSNISSEKGFCDSETTNGPEGTVEWSEAQVNVSRFHVCPFGPNNKRISRLCVSRMNWTTPNASECATNVTQGLQTLNETLKEINTTNLVEFTSNLTQLVNSSSIPVTDQTTQNSQIVSDVLFTTSVLIRSPNVNLKDSLMITRDIVVILDNVEEWPQENIQNQSTIIITAFESVTTSLVQKDNFTKLPVVTNDIALVAERVTVNSIEEEGRSFVVNQVNGALEVNRGGQTNISLQENQPAILTFPSGIDLQELVMNNNGDDVGIFFVVYEKDTWFPVSTDQENRDPVGSAVVSFTIAGLPSGTVLPQPISINLRIADPNAGSSENIKNATCVFYNFTILRWDPTGCETIYNPDVNPDEVTCRCSHLTNFASLVDISSRSTEDNTLTNAQRLSLHVVTYIGVVLSLVGLLVTIVTLLIFKKIRKRDVTKFHLQLCISLVCMYIVFVSGIDSTDNRGGCVTVGVMIHYFSLVAWMWMGAEALLMFQKLIIVFGSITWKYILFISVLCWSIPVIPVLISVSVDPDHYITTYNDNTTRSGFCFISHIGVFFGAFLGPIFLVIVFNTVIYALVIRVIVKRNMEKNKVVSGKYSMTGLEVFKLLLSICGIMFLFGLSWIFAVFTFIRAATYVFQLLFAIFNAFQGFWIFFFFILLNSETREAWKSLIECCSTAKASTTLTSNSSKSGNTRPTPLLASNATSSTAAPASDSVVPDNNRDHESTSGNNRIVSGDGFIRIDSIDIVEELEREADNESLPEIPLKPLGVRFKDEDGLPTEESWEGDENIMKRMLRRLTRLKKHEVQEIKIDFNE